MTLQGGAMKDDDVRRMSKVVANVRKSSFVGSPVCDDQWYWRSVFRLLGHDKPRTIETRASRKLSNLDESHRQRPVGSIQVLNHRHSHNGGLDRHGRGSTQHHLCHKQIISSRLSVREANVFPQLLFLPEDVRSLPTSTVVASCRSSSTYFLRRDRTNKKP